MAYTSDTNNRTAAVGERRVDRRVILVLVAGAIFFLIIFGILLMTVFSPEKSRGVQDQSPTQQSGQAR